MKLLPAAVAGALCLVMAACGQSKGDGGTVGGPSQHQVDGNGESSRPMRDADRDDDVGAPNDDIHHASVLRFGRLADMADSKAVTRLIKSYYAAALADDGAKACTMLEGTLAKIAATTYGRAPAPSYLIGSKSCAEVTARLFRHSHSRLKTEVPTLAVKAVRVDGDRGLTLLSFGPMPERQITVRREGRGTWKIGELLDSELP